MKKVIRRVVVAALILVSVYIASCSIQSENRTKAIESIAIGDSGKSAIEKLGEPSRRETPGAPYLIYATQGCILPCANRLWWEWPLFRGIEAWSVELDSNQKVVEKVHWSSP